MSLDHLQEEVLQVSVRGDGSGWSAQVPAQVTQCVSEGVFVCPLWDLCRQQSSGGRDCQGEE